MHVRSITSEITVVHPKNLTPEQRAHLGLPEEDDE